MTCHKSPCRMYSRLFMMILVAVTMGCQQAESDDSPFHKGKALGRNNNERLEEASGLAASARYPGCMWAHNDSGHPADLFLLDSLGQTKREFRLAKIRNRDWEDIAIGPGADGKNYIYIGDIGDNYARYPFKYIYRLEEPALDHVGKLHGVDTLVVRLSDKIRDTETLMIDPITRNIYFLSKKESNVGLYEIKYPFIEDTLTANRIATLPLRRIVGGDISRDGKEILVKSYEHIYYWKRDVGQSISEAMMAPGIRLSYKQESMGEAIAWAHDGSGFFTLGENSKGDRAKFLYYKRRHQNPPDSSIISHPLPQ